MADRVINTPVTVTVASIKAVQPGKKMGAIYGIDGQRWGVWGSEIDKFVVGGAYKILSHKEGEFQGMILKTVGDYEYVGAPTQATQKAAQAVKANAPSASSYAQGGDAENTRRRDIFVCGALNSYLSTKEGWTEDGLVKFVDCLKRVWERTLGPNAPKKPVLAPQTDDMNDLIPDFGEAS